ncbi:DUF5993 family protein [Gimesia fumaroli]|uniref:DUF5993 family protein n=1 Tax=Gimesia fumaroli TaxID=2527976 RepID=UPI0018D9D767|nr:DUF5993 family protein [Gimesia fumaroli]
MDTLIFLLILLIFLAMWIRKRWLVYSLFLTSLVATYLLFLCHASNSLELNF